MAACVAGALLILVAADAPRGDGETRAGGAAIVFGAPWVVARGDGTRGAWRQNESDFDYVDDPAVAIDGRGNVALAWVDQGRKDVLFQVFGADGRPRLDRPRDVSRTPTVFSWLPRVAFTSEDGSGVAVVWQEIVFSGGSHGGDVFFARSVDGGRSFTNPVNLTRSVEGEGKGRLDRSRWDNGSLDLAVAPDGVVHVAWTEYEGRLWTARSTDGGATFSAPLRIEGPDGSRPARGPSLAAGDRGALFLAWTTGEDPCADIQVAVSRDAGRSFQRARVAVATPGLSDAPRLAVASGGALHLVFAEKGRPDEAPRVVHARADAGTLAFSAPVAVHAPGEGRAGGSFPDLAVGPDGTVYVVSEIVHADGEARGLQLSVSRDGGRTFSPPVVVPGSVPSSGTNGGQQGGFLRRLAVRRTGELVIGMSTFHRGVASEVSAVRGR
jgi:hypothetical protein